LANDWSRVDAGHVEIVSRMINVYVRGLQELQAANVELMQSVSPRGGLGEAVKQATIFLHRYAVRITHRVTGTLAASHTMNFASGGIETFWRGIRFKSMAVGQIYINPASVNPVTNERPVAYGPVEEARGGSHAFYRRTLEEAGPTAGNLAIAIIYSKLPKGQSIFGVASRVRGF
jgi:hypothetical protein